MPFILHKKDINKKVVKKVKKSFFIKKSKKEKEKNREKISALY